MRYLLGIPVLMFGAILVAAFTFALTRAGDDSTPMRHTCLSPCTVVFPDHVEEDEWWVDYGWRDKHTPVLGVYVCPPGDMSGRCG
jgi:hypothetical protein